MKTDAIEYCIQSLNQLGQNLVRAIGHRTAHAAMHLDKADEALAELAALKKDTARLDDVRLWIYRLHKCELGWYLTGQVNTKFYDDPRAAIDAAMESEE